MATPQVQLDVCKFDGSLLSTAKVNDAVLRATTSNQRLLLGVQGMPVALALSSNVVSMSSAVGINTSNPLAALDVRGSAVVSGYLGVNVTSNADLINNSAYGLLITHSNDAMRFMAFTSNTSNTLLTLSSNVMVHGGQLIIDAPSQGVLTSTSDAFTLTHSAAVNMSAPFTGINTSTPQYTLDVAGTTRTPALRIESNANVCTIAFNDTTNNLDIQGLSLTSNAFVGVAQPSPLYALDIGSGPGDVTSVVRINTSDSNPDKIYLTSQGSNGPRIQSSNNRISLITTGGPLTFNTLSGNQESVRVDTVGNLGVGTVPGHKLDVGGDINFTGILRKNGDEYFAGVPGWSNAPDAIYTYCNVGFGVIPNSNYAVDVNGNLNIDGSIMLNGYQFLNGGLTSNFQAVTRFQVSPTNAVFQASNVSATTFNVTVPGNVAATPQNITVTMNGMKLSYVDDNNYDYQLTSASDGGTTVFTVTLNSSLTPGDVLDLTIWPYIPGNRGVFVDVSNIDLLTGGKATWVNSNNNVYIIGSNVGIGVSNPQVSLDVRGTDAILIPSGTTNQRPIDFATTGMIRYNTTLNTFEGLGAGYAWGSLGGVKDTNQDTYISAESGPNCNEDIIYFYNSNIERMRLTKEGNLGVGTSNPIESLDLIGNIKASSNIYGMTRFGVGTSNPQVSIDVRGTDAVLIPSGTTNQRPAIFTTTGMIRYNTTLNTFEGFGAGNTWGSLGGVKDTNQDTYISAESGPNCNEDIIYFYNSNIERMRITRQGNVGVGTSNPAYMLDVAGTGYFREDLTINSNLAVNRSISMQGVYIKKNITGGPANFTMVSVPGLCNDPFGNLLLYNQTTQASQGVIFAARNFPSTTLTELGRFTGSGRFGIGRSNPLESLDLLGNIKASSNIYGMARLGVGTSNPTESLEVQGNTKINQNMYVLSNVGIGTSNPTVALEVTGNAKVSSNLEVVGNLTIRGITTTVDSTTVTVKDNVLRLNNGAAYSSSLQAGLEINRGSGSNDYLLVFDEPSNYFKVGQQGQLQTVATRDDNPASHSLMIYDNASKKLTACNSLTFSNNVLEVQGIMNSKPNAGNNAFQGLATGLTSGQFLHIALGQSNTPSNAAVIKYTHNGLNNNTNNAQFGLWGFNHITCAGNGNVGINTATPTESLHVTGGKLLVSANQILGYVGDTATVPAYSWADDSNTGIYHPAADTIGMVTNGTERVRLTSTGNFGIGGATTFNNSLSVSGNASIGSSYATTTAPAHGIIIQGYVGIGTNNPSYPLHVASGSGSTSIFAAGDITGLSDASVKTDMRIIEDALAKVHAIHGYTFRRTDGQDGDDKRHAGVIAQEVQSVLPEVVSEDIQNGKLCVAYGNMIALLIEAIKELDRKISAST